ncbi:MAG: hypothetical protein K0S57_90 [Ramlibacter sp.]|nr:hypothetical protein [Ramlibacter sp.]
MTLELQVQFPLHGLRITGWVFALAEWDDRKYLHMLVVPGLDCGQTSSKCFTKALRSRLRKHADLDGHCRIANP